MLRVLAFLCLTFVSAFFLSLFLSTILVMDPWLLLSTILSEEVVFAVLLSFFTATCSTLISLMVSIPVSYALSRLDFPGKTFIDGFLDIPVAVPPIALGVMLIIFFSKTPIGLFINESVVRFVFEVPGIVLAQFAVICVLTIKLVKASFDGVPVRYERVARTLGYTEFQAFLHVTLPAAKRGILGAALISWARALGEFGATVTLAGATRFKTETLSIALYLNLSAANIEKAAAIICTLLAIACAVLVVARKLLHRGLAA
ncbi:MAG: ABC transporter permease [Candidatus Bathyarchaeia archaeon]